VLTIPGYRNMQRPEKKFTGLEQIALGRIDVRMMFGTTEKRENFTEYLAVMNKLIPLSI
jgi:hypothetical protein